MQNTQCCSQRELCRQSITVYEIIGYAGEASMPHFTVDMTVRDYELDQYGVGYLLTKPVLSCYVSYAMKSHHAALS